MDSIYALGVDFIVLIQKKFATWEDFLMLVNNVADPNRSITHLFPVISVFDSVLASEFILVAAITGWLNSILKWLLIEDRPYWWIKETHHYGPIRANKPLLRLNSQTCETGPGCPSGHVMSTAAIFGLFCSWIILDKVNLSSRYKRVVKYLSWFVSAVCIILVSLSRMYVATHFPHQCLLGMILGFLIAHFVPTYWIRPYVDFNPNRTDVSMKDDDKYKKHIRKYITWHAFIIIGMIIISFVFYWGQKLIGIDPSWSVKLAFKWCPSPDFLHFNTTPFYALAMTMGNILGWIISVTPSIKKYFSGSRSMIVAALPTFVFQQIFQQWLESISRDNVVYFYSVTLLLFALQPFIFLKVVPLLSTIGRKINQPRRADASAATPESTKKKL